MHLILAVQQMVREFLYQNLKKFPEFHQELPCVYWWQNIPTKTHFSKTLFKNALRSLKEMFN